MLHLKRFLVVFISFAILTYGQGNTFTKVRYNGGSVPSKVNPKDWDNKLTISSDTIRLELKDGAKVEILPNSVTGLSYGQEAHRRVGTMIALAILVAPVALFGLFHKTRLHFIAIQYKTADGKSAGILLQGDKDNYRAILVALQGVANVPVSVAEKDREFIPVGVKTDVTKNSEEPENASQPPAQPATTADATGTVTLTTSPDGADVLVDDQFYGNSPATLKLKPGKHRITVKMSGYKDWFRDLTTDSGTEVHLSAPLEKLN
jgi:hypothetical protein